MSAEKRYVESPNSPFRHSRFSMYQAVRWVERNKADFKDGMLVFRDQFSLAIMQQVSAEQRDEAETVAYGQMVNSERGGQTIGQWRSTPGKAGARGGRLITRTMQMKTYLVVNPDASE